MKKEMLINCLQPEEIRIAILEDGVLEELYVERASHESYVGNIYKGRVVNIEPSIQAAFVDFGVGRNGFLHVSDVEPEYYRRFEQQQSRQGDRGGRGERGGRGGRPQQRNYDDYDRPQRGGFRQQPPMSGMSDDVLDLPPIPPAEHAHPAAQDFDQMDDDVPDIIVEQIIEDDAYDQPRIEMKGTEQLEAPLQEDPRQEAKHLDEPIDAATLRQAQAFHHAPDPVHVEPMGEPDLAPTEEAWSEPCTPPTAPTEEAKSEPSAPAEEPAEAESASSEEEEGDEEKPKRKGRKKATGKTPRAKKPARKRAAKDEGTEEAAPSEGEEMPQPRPMESSERRTDEHDPSLGPVEPRPAPDLRDEDLSFSMAPQARPKPEPKPEPVQQRFERPEPEPVQERFERPEPVQERFQPQEPPQEPMQRFEEEESLTEIVEEEKSLEQEFDGEEPIEVSEITEGLNPMVDLDDEHGEIDDYASRERGQGPDRGRGDRGGDRGRGRGGDRGGDRGRGRSNDRGGDRGGDRGRGRSNDRGNDRGGDRNRGRGADRGGRPPMGRPGMGRPKPHIEDIFKRGQEVLVQVIKEGIGTKGPTLSTYISIAGRYLVLMPGLNRIGVSRKIDDEETRRRLREILSELKPPRGIGFIIRTAGQDRNKKELQSDLAYLSRLWQVVVGRIGKQKSPSEIYKESDMVTRTIRDIFTSDITTIWVDERGAYEAAKEFMEAVMPRYADRIKFYEGSEPMFHKYGIESEIARIQQRHVPLPHGGSIVIDQTEALVAIDVNSGNFRADNNNAEETAYQMNLHAAKEIARQLRLRDLGGVIANDFIDMRDERHRRGVERALHDAVRRDRARTKILRISQFGIIEMTRQRIRPSLKRSAFQDCQHCRGTGHVKTGESVSIEVMRMLQLAVHREHIQRIEIRVHEEVAQYLQNRKRKDIVALEESGKKSITIHSAGAAVSPEHLEFLCYDANDNEVKANVQEEARPPRRRSH